MRRIVSRIPRRDLVAAFPKASLGALPMLISFELGFALLAGYFAAHYFAGKKTKEQGRVPSLVFSVRQWKIHLHHWFLFLGIFVGAGVTQFFIVAPFVFYGFLGGVIAQGILHYDDWLSIVSRQRAR